MTMLLALDTATRTLSLALHDGAQVIAESTWQTAGRHTVELTPAILSMLAAAALTPAALTHLAVSQGPGSFNGLRVGFSAAKGLALALGVPLIAVPTLDVVAASQPPFAGALIAVAQAGRGRVVMQSYAWVAGAWVGQGDTQIIAWGKLLEPLRTPTLISGEIDADGGAAIRAAVAAGQPVHRASPAFSLRRAGFLAELAWERWRVGRVTDPTGGAPFYLHQPGVPHP
jgi:tRNA threonylcarbamoyladenosine biosynthesis protein TsaB